MKRIISVICSFVFVASVFSGCGKNNEIQISAPNITTEAITSSLFTNTTKPDAAETTAINTSVADGKNENYKPSSANYVTLISPASGTAVNFHTDKQNKFLADGKGAIPSSVNGKKELSRPNPIEFRWENSIKGEFYSELRISENIDMSNSAVYSCVGNRIYIDNFKANTVYYWNVTSNGVTSNISLFITGGAPRNLNIDGITNVRDLGGNSTLNGGRTKQGLLYRCGRLNESSVETPNIEITEQGISTMRNLLGVKTEIDLRQSANGETGGITQSPLGADINYYNCPMKWDGNMFTDNTDEIIHVFEILANRDNYPIIFHCNIGTDRTGMIAFFVNALLGVTEEDIITDYLFSNFGNIGGTRKETKVYESGYYKAIQAANGATLASKTYNCLVNIGVPRANLDSVIEILTEK